MTVALENMCWPPCLHVYIYQNEYKNLLFISASIKWQIQFYKIQRLKLNWTTDYYFNT